ncbi:ribbon-helix-helix domain-containing protein [Phenylobacterium sp.]|uniref:ribbon-helix-helix domain-containing protein n=1 Tax=Phenylobacterium sp. TaxID=1871053 RepID=UPI0035B29880
MPRLRKRSILLSGHATSVALETEFWTELEEMAAEQGVSLAALMAEIDETRADTPLASACRLAALAHAKTAARG